MSDSTQRATCWSITINNPVPTDIPVSDALPAKWVLQGQLEEGKEGTTHYQGMLTTPQTRFSQVKKIFPRAHIEIAKNRTALEKYVHKSDTRIMEIPTVSSSVPTLFDYQSTIAGRWVSTEFDKYIDNFKDKEIGEVALLYVDSLVEKDIINGMRGIEFIAINPMWRSSWKKFWRGIILRHRSIEENASKDSEVQEAVSPDEEEELRQETPDC